MGITNTEYFKFMYKKSGLNVLFSVTVKSTWGLFSRLSIIYALKATILVVVDCPGIKQCW